MHGDRALASLPRAQDRCFASRASVRATTTETSATDDRRQSRPEPAGYCVVAIAVVVSTAIYRTAGGIPMPYPRSGERGIVMNGANEHECESDMSLSAARTPVPIRRRDKLVIYATVACVLVAPWQVALITRNPAVTSATVIVPLLVGGSLLTRQGWRAPRTVDRPRR